MFSYSLALFKIWNKQFNSSRQFRKYTRLKFQDLLIQILKAVNSSYLETTEGS